MPSSPPPIKDKIEDQDQKEEEENERYRVLVEFAYKHLDFQIAELESILDMYDIQLDSAQCQIEKLPRNDTTKSQRPFLILSFPFKDANRLSSSSSSSSPSNYVVDRWKCNNPIRKTDASIAEIISRCTLVKSVVELWGAAESIDECAKSTKNWIHNSKLGKRLFQSEATPKTKSWKMNIHTFGSKYTRQQQDEMRSEFSYLGFEGPVKMEDPDNEYVVIREVEMDGKGAPLYPNHRRIVKATNNANDGSNNDRNKNNEVGGDGDGDGGGGDSSLPPLAVYFGRVLGDQKRKKGTRNGLEQYNLKKRKFLGPTSMDAELSFVMTNFGQVHRGSIVYDPFVGTGSILLSAALRGAYCFGSDIDIRILKGKSPNENIWTNFDQYNLQRPEILRTDNAIYHKHFREHAPLYDAILCDPPYGIRAGARKTGSRLDQPRPISDEHRHDHIPQTKPYAVSDVMSDLLDVAARTLCMGGRLVYVIPSFSQNFDENVDLPRHNCLQLVHCCYQPLSVELGRRIVAMKKIKEYDFSKRSQYLDSIWVNGKESAEKCANIRDKILEHAKQKPGYEEKAAIRREKRKATKQAKKEAKRKKIEEEQKESSAVLGEE